MSNRAANRTLAGLILKHDNRCVYCGVRVTKASPHRRPRPTDATRDHFRPRSLGGSSRPDNVVLACFSCNQLKGNLSPAVFIVLRWMTGGQPR